MKRYLEFLDSREGAPDSDVEALMKEFSLSKYEAQVVYRTWLDTLVELDTLEEEA